MTLVAEVVVRFAGTVLDVAHVRPGGTFRIGSAPRVDLAISLAGITTFPLVDGSSGGFVVRRPASAFATHDGAVMTATELRLGPSETIELRFGATTITIALAELPAAPIPRTRLERRTPVYLAVALLAHLFVWAIAITFADPPRAPTPRPVFIAHPREVRIATRDPDRPRPPLPPVRGATAMPSGQADVQVRPTAAIESAGDAGSISGLATMMEGAARLAKAIDDMHVPQALAETGPLYVPDDHVTFGGGGRAFDPTQREGWGTIKTGRYQTVASGRAAGDHYSIEDEHARVHVRLCDGDCTAVGPLERAEIDYLLGYKLRDFATCYQPASADAVELKLELVIGPNGKVRAAQGRGKAGACAARIASTVAFPVAHDETRVSYSLTFVPPAG